MMRKNLPKRLAAAFLSAALAVSLPGQSYALDGPKAGFRDPAFYSAEDASSGGEPVSDPERAALPADPYRTVSSGQDSRSESASAHPAAPSEDPAAAPEERDISAINNPLKGRGPNGDEITTWDCVYLRDYSPEDGNTGQSSSPEETSDGGSIREAEDKILIKWRVLKLEPDGEALLQADKPIGEEGFALKGFSEEEKELIDTEGTGGPAMRINLLTSDSWEYAGTMSSDGTVSTAVDKVKKPHTDEYGNSVWDCVWFGSFWQDDNNGDGYCFSDDLYIEAESGEYHADGERIPNFHGKEGVYPADDKEPVKWRVLDKDDAGNVLLLSDRLIDIFEFNKKDENTSWEKSDLRSYLNSTGKYADSGFLSEAFTASGIAAITESGTGSDKDLLFCLSADEVQNPDYGFSDDNENSRTARYTNYTFHKPGYDPAENYEYWWLRTPDHTGYYVSAVDSYGSLFDLMVDGTRAAVRPALRMNLADSDGLWRYAGTVDSEGNVSEEGRPVSCLKVTPEQRTLKVGQSIKAECRVIPGNAADRTFTWSTTDESIATIEDGVVTACGEGQALVKAVTKDGGVEGVCVIDVVPAGYPADPVTSEGVSTWDCIWFGNYWQGDTNGDGYCFSKDLTIRKEGYFYYDQDNNKVPNFNGKTGDYPADGKQPVKWRILDVDEEGNAFLISDKLIDVSQYDKESDPVSWEKCDLRSYLNGSFLKNAFSDDEKKSIILSEIQNDMNPVHPGSIRSKATKDRIFCLSVKEAMNPGHGFLKNDFRERSPEDPKYFTEDDTSRQAAVTDFASHKPGIFTLLTEGSFNRYWLRTPGKNDTYASQVTYGGAVDPEGQVLAEPYAAVRPALFVNLSDTSLWNYAGTVSSDGTSDTEAEGLKGVRTKDGVSTWDCIWFGNYWQGDTNGDGYCFSEDTAVIKDGDRYYAKYGEDDKKQIVRFDGEPGLYPADDRQPVKWRILDIDDGGNALLLSDKLIDIAQYNEERTEVTWETCTLRSYLNCYDGKTEGTANGPEKGFTGTGFLKRAFSEAEISAMAVSAVKNEDNPFYGVSGGNRTKDRLFCLSLSEATDPDLGFVKNEFKIESDMRYTEADDTRKAEVTDFTRCKPGYWESAEDTDTLWQLRSPGRTAAIASTVNDNGAVFAFGDYVDSVNYCLRPAFRMNLFSSSALWDKAGTVSSDGKETKEIIPVRGVSFPDGRENLTIIVGEEATLIPTITPSDATDQTVSWVSSEPSVASVDDNGRVKGLKTGEAVITVKTDYRGYEAHCKVTVRELRYGLDVDKNDLELNMIPGEVRRLRVNRDGVHLYGVRYTLKDPGDPDNPKGKVKCVSVKNGVVTAKAVKKKKGEDISKPDEAWITAEYCGRSETFRIKVYGASPVNVPIEDVETKKKYRISAPKTLKLIFEPGKNTNKTVSVSIPKQLRAEGKTISCSVKCVEPGAQVCRVKEGNEEDPWPKYNDPDRAKASKAVFEIEPLEAGSAYIEWSMTDDKGTAKAYTKVTVKKPVSAVSVNYLDDGALVGGSDSKTPDMITGLTGALESSAYAAGPVGSSLHAFGVGGGGRLIVITDKGNTDTKDPSFKVQMKQGKGVKVSKSGFLTATAPEAAADIIVKAGKVQSRPFSVTVSDAFREGFISLNKVSASVKAPKSGSKKPASIPLKAAAKTANPKKKALQPAGVVWKVIDPETGEEKDSLKGIKPVPDEKDGCRCKVLIDPSASPGCYVIEAKPEGTGYNTVYCDVTVK